MGTNKKISQLTSIDTYDSTTYVPVSTGDGKVTRKLAVTSISPSGSGFTPYETGFGIDIDNNIISVDTNDLNNTYSLNGHTHSQYLESETDPIYTSEKDTLALKTDLDSYSLNGHTHSQYLESETDPIYTSEKGTLALKPFTFDVQLVPFDWYQDLDGSWAYHIVDNRFVDSYFIDVIPKRMSADVVDDAQIYSEIEKISFDAIRIRSKFQPTNDIYVIIRIIK